VDWQRIVLQENPGDVPSGCLPRTLEVILRADEVEEVKPGDRVVFCGSPVPIPEQGKRHPGEATIFQKAAASRQEGVGGAPGFGMQELTYRISFWACHAELLTETEIRTVPQKATIERIRAEPDLYGKLARSVCPQLYGHEEIRRGILIMLLGGVAKKDDETGALRIRGDINVCIVGDPSTAKSQFLKWTAGFVERGVYTSGQSASAAGLTASVVRDEETGYFTIDAGAMILADQGVCCIDEFDKMNPTDQVAIHEAMEQQTISIAKAGIHATSDFFRA
jgi:DNA replication licensing factor MCM6